MSRLDRKMSVVKSGCGRKKVSGNCADREALAAKVWAYRRGSDLSPQKIADHCGVSRHVVIGILKSGEGERTSEATPAELDLLAPLCSLEGVYWPAAGKNRRRITEMGRSALLQAACQSMDMLEQLQAHTQGVIEYFQSWRKAEDGQGHARMADRVRADGTYDPTQWQWKQGGRVFELTTLSLNDLRQIIVQCGECIKSIRVECDTAQQVFNLYNRARLGAAA